jgi:hypothetical protein
MSSAHVLLAVLAVVAVARWLQNLVVIARVSNEVLAEQTDELIVRLGPLILLVYVPVWTTYVTAREPFRVVQRWIEWGGR